MCDRVQLDTLIDQLRNLRSVVNALLTLKLLLRTAYGKNMIVEYGQDLRTCKRRSSTGNIPKAHTWPEFICLCTEVFARADESAFLTFYRDLHIIHYGDYSGISYNYAIFFSNILSEQKNPATRCHGFRVNFSVWPFVLHYFSSE